MPVRALRTLPWSLVACLLAACGDSSDMRPGAPSGSAPVAQADGAVPTDVSTDVPADVVAPANADERYLVGNALRDGVTVTASGLQYEVLDPADGPMPGTGGTVTLHYVGTLVDGTEFDSSVARGEPATFALAGTIDGFAEGVALMSVGSAYRFVMPADIAYGERGSGDAIAPGATLIFEVRLLEINSV